MAEVESSWQPGTTSASIERKLLWVQHLYTTLCETPFEVSHKYFELFNLFRIFFWWGFVKNQFSRISISAWSMRYWKLQWDPCPTGLTLAPPLLMCLIGVWLWVWERRGGNGFVKKRVWLEMGFTFVCVNGLLDGVLYMCERENFGCLKTRIK